MGGRRWVANLDIYRKVPGDLVEGTRQGRLLSWAALLLICTLFILETKSFLSSEIQTDLFLDNTDSEFIRVNFNISMLDLRCEYAAIDVVSVLGTEQNVTKNVKKWTVDSDGMRQRLVMNSKRHQTDIHLSDAKVTQSLEELHEEGEDAVSLDSTTFEFAKTEYEFLFVDFYASWCSHCRTLSPTWEMLAKVMVDAGTKVVDEDHDSADYSKEEYEEAIKLEMPVVIAKIDCVDHRELCQEEGIRSYPTLRLFIDAEPYSGGDYYGDRTVLSLTQYLESAEDKHRSEMEDDERFVHLAQEHVERRMNVTEEEKQWAQGMERVRSQKQDHLWNPKDHPGCQLSGHLMLNRAPGNFFIQARSSTLDLAPHMTNVSHQVHHLSFGDDRLIHHLKNQRDLKFPGNIVESTTPMEEYLYATHKLHEAYHHYLKLVATRFDNQIKTSWMRAALEDTVAYQVLQSTELAFYRDDIVPEAKFVIDLSPIAVSYRMKERKWYQYITSLMAIIGGTFTVLGFFEAGVRTVTSKHHITPVKRRH